MRVYVCLCVNIYEGQKQGSGEIRSSEIANLYIFFKNQKIHYHHTTSLRRLRQSDCANSRENIDIEVRQEIDKHAYFRNFDQTKGRYQVLVKKYVYSSMSSARQNRWLPSKQCDIRDFKLSYNNTATPDDPKVVKKKKNQQTGERKVLSNKNKSITLIAT